MTTPAFTFKGNPVTVEGTQPKVGDAAPDFKAVDTGLNTVKFSDIKGDGVVVLSVVPSLDTGICEAQTKRFNDEAASLNAKVFTISEDLPFAQKRFCGMHGIDNSTVLSDARDRSFSKAYSIYINELGLLVRSVWIIGKDGKIAYRELVPEVATHPDYDKAIEAAIAAAGA